MEKPALVSIFIDYGNKKINSQIEAKTYNEVEIFDIATTIESTKAFSFIDKDFERAVDATSKEKIKKEKKDLLEENSTELAKQRLQLSMKYTELSGQLIRNVKSLLVNEFSMSDIQVIEAIVEKSAKKLDEDTVEKIFVSEETFKKIKSKIGDPIISILGKRNPIGIGYGLTDKQIMLEGGKTVIVSDLDIIIEGYIPDKIKT